MRWVNCLKTLNKLTMCLPGKTPSAPSVKEKIKVKVYEPAYTPYRSKWFYVMKKDGGLRIVHDLQELNKVTIRCPDSVSGDIRIRQCSFDFLPPSTLVANCHRGRFFFFFFSHFTAQLSTLSSFLFPLSPYEIIQDNNEATTNNYDCLF
jgi:hypothetical protein